MIDQVRAHIAERASAPVNPAAPVERMIDRMEGDFGRGPEIQIPIECGRLREVIENGPRGFFVEFHLRPVVAETARGSVTASGHSLSGGRSGRLSLRLRL